MASTAKLFGVLVSIILFSTKAFAENTEVLYQTCAACHGDKGQGNQSLKAPAIAGQHVWYIERQLKHFIDGTRGSQSTDVGGQQMRASVSQLNKDTDVPALAAYIAGMPSLSLPDAVKGDLMNGSRYYQAKCGACHGGKAEGNASFNAPKLSNLHSEYLMQQMKNFINGNRGSHPEDTLGKQMSMMARIVNEKELADIVYYISQQK
ncbi:c-type cytochrome [Thalassotalea euphylliae]|uniref:c-type cytochrome n=1 Tax=Thalassotalea euphylliae TaxID=1655234 RepID=UPI003625EA23